MIKINKKWILLLLIVFLIPMIPYLLADSPAPNEPYRTESSNAKFYIEMIPDGGWGGYGEGEGIVYQTTPDGGGQRLWAVPFYSSEVILTGEGKSLIAFGPWAMELSDLAIVFYWEGRELKSYTVADLIQDETRLERSVSHFLWREYSPSAAGRLSDDETKFTLPLIDGSIYVFDVTTGNIVEKTDASSPL